MSAEYQSLPQAPQEAGDNDEDVIAESLPEGGHLNNRIRWIHFVFGSAVLLPWNGEKTGK